MGERSGGSTEIPTGEGGDLLLHNGGHTIHNGADGGGSLHAACTAYAGGGGDILPNLHTDVRGNGDYLDNAKTLISQYE